MCVYIIYMYIYKCVCVCLFVHVGVCVCVCSIELHCAFGCNIVNVIMTIMLVTQYAYCMFCCEANLFILNRNQLNRNQGGTTGPIKHCFTFCNPNLCSHTDTGCPYEPKVDDPQYFGSGGVYQKCAVGMIFVAGDVCTCIPNSTGKTCMYSGFVAY